MKPARTRPGGDTRARALAILLEVEGGRFASDVMQPREARFVRELVLGVLRRRLTLDHVHAAYGRRVTEELDPPVRAGVRIGLYQMLFMDGVPPHAIVAETVSALHGGGRGYVNALLRTVLRESRKLPEAEDHGGASPTKRLHRPGRSVSFFSKPVFPDPARDRVGWLAAVHSHPRLLVERWLARVGEDAAVARMERANAPQPLVLRPRIGRTDAEGLIERLAREQLVPERIARPQGDGDAVLLAAQQDGALSGAAFRAGLFSVQDIEQMDAAEILAPRPEEVLWDACAAPGGKTAQLAEVLQAAGGSGRVVATDRSAERLARLQANVERLGLSAVTTAVHDALSESPPPGCPAGGFDAVLLDAPCSNTAVLGRRPEARWRLGADTFEVMAAQQRRLIEAVSRHLAPGGRLVYSVCSFEPEEGADHGLAPTRSPLVWTRP